jgi:AhpD family alkylhydroperoxidase
MQSRLDFPKVSPQAVQAMLGLEAYLNPTSLDPSLRDLLKMRASQLNGCAYCIDMHSKDLRAAGESEQRLYLLDAWREAPFYTERERAALGWIEALTRVADDHVPDQAYEDARRHFNERELVNLAMVAVAINGWNRLCVAFRSLPGTYQPSVRRVVEASGEPR